VEEARERMGTAPAAAAAALERASGRLSGLAEVYLPLLRARAAATNAYRYYRLEDQHGALGALDRAERWILLIGRQPADLEAELEGLTEEIGRAREAVDQGLPEAVLHLERLAGTLTDVLGRDEIFP
ncbi:MAG: hypothetical protein ACLFRX_01020, partial [Gemmatimonadota bacterium]